MSSLIERIEPIENTLTNIEQRLTAIQAMMERVVTGRTVIHTKEFGGAANQNYTPDQVRKAQAERLSDDAASKTATVTWYVNIYRDKQGVLKPAWQLYPNSRVASEQGARGDGLFFGRYVATVPVEVPLRTF